MQMHKLYQQPSQEYEKIKQKKKLIVTQRQTDTAAHLQQTEAVEEKLLFFCRADKNRALFLVLAAYKFLKFCLLRMVFFENLHILIRAVWLINSNPIFENLQQAYKNCCKQRWYRRVFSTLYILSHSSPRLDKIFVMSFLWRKHFSLIRETDMQGHALTLSLRHEPSYLDVV